MGAGQLLAFIELLGRSVLVPLGMTERRVVVEADLGIEGVHTVVGSQDQWIDLGQVAVALGEAAVQLDEDLGSPIDGDEVESSVDTCLPCIGKRQAVDWIDVHHDDGVGVRGRDGFDLDPALRRQHQQMLLGGTIERE